MAVREIIAQERGAGHNNVADELEKALVTNISQRRKGIAIEATGHGYSSKNVPTSKGDQFPLIEIKQPELDLDDIVLDVTTQNRLEKIVEEHVHRHDLANYGLRPVGKVLFYGPPGCGKTLAAHVLSGMLRWAMLYVRFDSVISSYLGETSANLRRVFDFASNGPSVLFFDEFDAIGKSRDVHEDVGELKRVVNSFLQMMDNFESSGILVSATNHEQLLDGALWRRFDEVVYFPMPSQAQIAKLLSLRLGSVNLRDFSPAELAADFNGLSFSDTTKICIESIKRMVLGGRTQLNRDDVLQSLAWFKQNRPEV